MQRKQTTTVTRNITFSAILLALAFVLPYFTGQLQAIGRMLSPLHIPAMLSAFVLPLPWAVLVSFIIPIIRSAIFTMPPMVPMALTMAFEMATYALVIGLLNKRLGNDWLKIIIKLVIAMVLGRIVYIIAFYLLLLTMNGQFNFQAVVYGLTVEGLPGIIVQLLLIPPIVLALKKAGFTREID